jgi:hypothetical protein
MRAGPHPEVSDLSKQTASPVSGFPEVDASPFVNVRFMIREIILSLQDGPQEANVFRALKCSMYSSKHDDVSCLFSYSFSYNLC